MSIDPEFYSQYVNLKHKRLEEKFSLERKELEKEIIQNNVEKKIDRIKRLFEKDPYPQGKTVMVWSKKNDLDKELIELYFDCNILSMEEKLMWDNSEYDDGYPLGYTTTITFSENIANLERQIQQLQEKKSKIMSNT